MSSFSGLRLAESALSAARAGMTVTGQNIANQTTTGYTRQRVDQAPLSGVGQTGLWKSGLGIGGGVSVTGVARLGDAVLDARVRDALSTSGFWSARATAAARAESTMAEPTADGLAANLDRFWAGWSDLANTPEPAAAQVVLTNAQVLVGQIAAGYQAVAGQWGDLRGQVDRDIADVNAVAGQVATLNGQIRDALHAGRNANELIDQRNVLAQQLASAIGATGVVESDGTLTLRVDGNALVSGDSSRSLQVSGPREISDAGRIVVSWADRPDVPVVVGGGVIGGTISDKYGRKPIIIIGLFLSVLSMFFCAGSQGVFFLSAMRGLCGFGGGLAIAVSSAVIRDSFENRTFQTITTLSQAIAFIGPIFAPAMGSFMIEFLSWRSIFIFLGVTSLLTLLPFLLFTETWPQAKRQVSSVWQATVQSFDFARDKEYMIFMLFMSLLTFPLWAYLSTCAYIYYDVFGVSNLQYSLLYAAGTVAASLAPFIYIWLDRRSSSRRVID
ncbi:MAG: flagellar hook-associated protein FlgK, partial [Microbacterium sp.]|nr:flagellar hook-associated protein FlgK [Microbacterium sp.]